MLLQTNRLFLQQLTKHDLPELNELFSNPKVMQFSLRGIENAAYCKQYLNYQQKLYKQNLGSFGIWDKDNIFLGCVGIIPVLINEHHELELGFRIKPKHWGSGIATEAASSLQEYALTFLHLSKLIALIHQENSAAINVAHKIGMSFETITIFSTQILQVYTIYNATPDNQ